MAGYTISTHRCIVTLPTPLLPPPSKPPYPHRPFSTPHRCPPSLPGRYLAHMQVDRHPRQLKCFSHEKATKYRVVDIALLRVTHADTLVDRIRHPAAAGRHGLDIRVHSRWHPQPRPYTVWTGGDALGLRSLVCSHKSWTIRRSSSVGGIFASACFCISYRAPRSCIRRCRTPLHHRIQPTLRAARRAAPRS